MKGLPERRGRKGPADLLFHNAMARTLSVFRFLLACVFVSVFFNIEYPAPESTWWALLLPPPEVTILVLGLLVAAWLGAPFRAALGVPVVALFIFLRLFRLGDVIVPFYFNRAFNLYTDIHYLVPLMDLLYRTVSRASFAVYAAGTLLATFACILVLWQAFKEIHRFFKNGPERNLFLVFLSAFVGFSSLYRPHFSFATDGLFAKGVSLRVAEEIGFLFRVRHMRNQDRRSMERVRGNSEKRAVRLEGLQGEDVYLFFIESYGRTVFKNPAFFAIALPALQDFEQSLKRKGFGICSNFLVSPTFGGTSWLAFGTFESGVRLENQTTYNLLLQSRVHPLAWYFNRSGYRTVSVMPGTRYPWPEGTFFGYQRQYDARSIAYAGPKYGWSPMPDQFVLDYIYRQEVKDHKGGLFIRYELGSSHAPFHCQPPYIEDWSRIRDGNIFYEIRPVTFPVVWPDLRNAGPAYIRSIGYELEVLRSYILQYLAGDELIILVGDHQPNAQITGPNSSWSVPIHVISRNREFLELFEARGYVEGMIPSQSQPHKGMETFLGGFLRDFGRQSTGPRG